MKKIFVFLLLMVVSFALKAQYPIQQNLGGDSTIIYIKGAARTVGGFINGTYTDTAAANLTRIRQYQAAQIFTTNDSAIWFRMPGATKWVRIMPATPPSPNVDTSYWSLSGNYVADRVATPRLGTTTGHELNIITNDSIRLTIPVYGIRRVTGNENRYLVIDTTIGSNMYVGYMDGGSGSTYTAGNGLTLSGSQFKLGSQLTENTTITTTGYDFNLPGIPTVSSTTRRKVVLIDTVTGKVERIDPSTINSNIYNTDGTIPGQRVVTIPDGSELQFFLDVVGKFNVTNDAGDTIIYALGDSGLFLPSIPTVSSTTGRKVALIDTTTGKVERIDPATLVTTPTLQQVLTAGSTLTTDANIDADGNDITFNNVNEFNINTTTDGVLLKSSAGGKESLVRVENDSIRIFPHQGILNIDSLRTWSGISDTTYKKPMTWDTRNGRWEYAANWYGGGGGGTPGGSTKQFQYNNAGAFAGSSMLTQETDNISIYGIGNTNPFRVDGHEDLTTEIVNITQSGQKKFAFHSNGSIEIKESGATYNNLYSLNGSLYTTNDAGRVAQVVQTLQLTFGAGSGADADTTAFTTSAIYGSFYNDADTIVVTSMRSVLQGTSPDVTYKVWYNDSLNVEAGATALNTAGNQVTSTTTGTNVTSITNTKIPPGVWVWVKTSTVATKPKYFSLTINGYRK